MAVTTLAWRKGQAAAPQTPKLRLAADRTIVRPVRWSCDRDDAGRHYSYRTGRLIWTGRAGSSNTLFRPGTCPTVAPC